MADAGQWKRQAPTDIPSADGSDPQISPDGTNIAFMYFGPANPEIYIVNLTGGSPQKIVDHGITPDWSPDGKSIVFGTPRTAHSGWYVNSEDAELRIIDVKSGKISVVPRSQGKWLPVWTSQNNLVAGFLASSRLTRYDFKTSTWSDLAAGPFSDWSSTDGTYIYCTTAEPAPPAAVRIRIADGRVEPIADLSQLRRIASYATRELSVSPKGELLFTRDIGTEEIYAVAVRWP